MSSYIQSQFAVSDKQIFDFQKPQECSDSEEEEMRLQLLILNNKDSKKSKKLFDIESIKTELNSRPALEMDQQPQKFGKKIQKASMRQLPNLFIPTSSLLIEQLGNIRAFKMMKEQVPPEVMHKVYTQLRYQYVSAFNVIYRQGDQNKRYYIVLDGRCVVMKPKEKMVGIQKVEFDIDNQTTDSKVPQDPYGLKNLFPDYLVVKVMFSGDSFGEVAIKLESSRASTVFAVENTHLLYMSEAAYIQLLDPYLSQILEEKIQYFKKNMIFTSVETDINEIMGILLECHKITYKAGETIYDEANKSNYIYFIISGEVELSKKVADTHLVLSSYGEYQQFGEVEILNKVERFTKARVITPRLIVYKIRKTKFFNNLGNFLVYENMKRKSVLIFKHWKLIYNSAQSQINKDSEPYLSSHRRKLQSKLSKHDSTNQSLSQVQVFQHLTDAGMLSDDQHQFASDDQGSKRGYSNALQQYQAKLKKQGNRASQLESATKQIRDKTFTTEDYQSPKNIVHGKFSFHVKLPAISPNKVLPQMNLDQILDSITKLPKVPPDNLVISLMYQQAYKSNNPDKRARQIQQVIQASFRNVRKHLESKEKLQLKPRFKSQDSLLKNLRMNDNIEEKKEKIDYLNFVHPKQLF
ncbi:unnamed protein product [Paramecium octaurelia]|uniref:Cyclic nucleotide-binding domain-containing protein n=1 Tax=Paramecium octaurelia TaxID=43137 RepID=A0A8S1U9T8_PAROT|nr:unnamed protein product [Paramecium octaurelia]